MVPRAHRSNAVVTPARDPASCIQMRRAAFALCLLIAAAAHAQTFALHGFGTARGVNASGPPSWLDGGFGRLSAGDGHTEALAVLQLGADWTPSPYFDLHASGVARRQATHAGRPAGIVDAYADVRAIRGRDTLQLRVGQFFLPSSRENKGELWTSPYMISFSALNTWIGEELRPVGADLEWRHETSSGMVLTAAATAFQNNDSLGALLGWRGWTIGNRLSVYNEVLPLPPLATLPTFFSGQRSDGTKPFGRDLDGRTGYAARVRSALPERANVQVMHVDNRGDRALSHGVYAWATAFTLLSLEIGRTDDTVFAAEYADGRSGMGFRGGGWVQMDLHAGYALVSHRRARNRFSARFDHFGTRDRDHSAAETNSEDGHAWTAAWMFDVTPKMRAGAEITQVTGDRPAAAESGYAASMAGRAVTLELRYGF